ncbi:MAG: hypothetical protein ACKN9F_02335 [Methylomonas sp.]
MKKIDRLILILMRVGMVVSALSFVFLLITDENHKNFDLMGGYLTLFWIFFMVAQALSDFKMEKDENLIPEEGRRIRITWLPHCINVPSNNPNPYIGMEGYVRELKPDGSFHLQCETSWLIVFGKYKFKYLD